MFLQNSTDFVIQYNVLDLAVDVQETIINVGKKCQASAIKLQKRMCLSFIKNIAKYLQERLVNLPRDIQKNL